MNYIYKNVFVILLFTLLIASCQESKKYPIGVDFNSNVLRVFDNGDNWCMTLGENDVLYTALCDGRGWLNADGSKKYDHQVNLNSGSVTAGDISDISNPFNFNMEDTSNTNRQSTSDTSRSNKLFRIDVFQVMDVSGLTE